MECGNFKEQISLMIDGELSASSSEALSAHMAGCPDCRTFYERLTAVDNAVKAAMPAIHGPLLAQRVKEKLAGRKVRRLQTDFTAWRRVPVMAMIVLVALGLGNLAGRSISELFSNGQSAAVIEAVSSDSGNSFSDVLLELGTEESQ